MALAAAMAHAQHDPPPQQSLPPAWASAIANLGADDAGGHRVDDVAYLWPCNVDAWRAWLGVQTQWRVGHAGATGLDYAGVRAWLAEFADTAEQRRTWFAGIQAAERATLDVWAEQQAERARRDAAPH